MMRNDTRSGQGGGEPTSYETPTLEKVPPILTVPEWARFMRISPTMAYERIHSNQAPPFIRFGRAIRIVGGDTLLKWLEEQAANAK